MSDQDWTWIIGLLVVCFVVWRKFGQAQSEPMQSEETRKIVPPPIPMPTHIRGVPIEATQRARSTVPVTPRPAVPSPAPVRPSTGRPTLPPKGNTSASTAERPKKKPWLMGPEREAWQKEEWEKKRKQLAEDDAARRAAAELRAEAKKQQHDIEKARGMAEADARMAEEAAKGENRKDRSITEKARDQQRLVYVSQKIPAYIKRDMNRFEAGHFDGPEQSPLTYVGYHVGVVRGTSANDRRQRLEVCFRVPIPRVLYAEYKHWGEPATIRRLNAMIDHMTRHAAMRASRPNFGQAVSEWEDDREWLRTTLASTAQGLSPRWSGF